MAVIDKEKIRKKAKKDPLFRPVCTICQKPIDVEEDGWQAVERNRGQITWICNECMKK